MTQDEEIQMLRNLRGMADAMKILTNQLKDALERIAKLEAKECK